MNTLIYIIFAATYILIASRKLKILPIGRPAGALFGAVLMVAVGALTPEESYRAIDNNTVLLLFAMMTLTVYLEKAGFFNWLAWYIISLCKTPVMLLLSIALVSALLSAFLVNDTVCLFLTPVIVKICLRANLPFTPYLLALATSANIGSAATFVGNPQNMIIGSLSGIGFGRFIAFSAPAAVAGLVVNLGTLYLYYGKNLSAISIEIKEINNAVDKSQLRRVSIVTLLVIVGFFAGFHLGYTAISGVLALILIERRDSRTVFAKVDWSLLLFFCCLFIVVAGLAKTGIIEEAWKASAPYLSFSTPIGVALFTGLMALGSNLVSNVPMVLLAAPFMDKLHSAEMGWVMLAFTTTIAGNLTLIGSVANIIVAEGAREHYQLGFLEYLRFGAVSTLLVLIIGVAVIYFVMG
ncbi:MAG: anion transporter [Myxococcota bacterium]